MSMMNRAKIALNGEQGGPSVETIIGIAVAMVMGVALIAFGNVVVEKTNDASTQVDTLSTNVALNKFSTSVYGG